MKKTGFTLVEMLVTIAILAIVLFIGVPSFKGIIRSSEMVSNSTDIITAFNYARVEAVKRGSSVELDQLDGSAWTGGLIVWIDSDGDSAIDSGEELRRWEAFNTGTTITSTNTAFTYSASGEVNNADSFTICDDRTGEKGRTISLLASGAIYAEKVTCL